MMRYYLAVSVYLIFLQTFKKLKAREIKVQIKINYLAASWGLKGRIKGGGSLMREIKVQIKINYLTAS